MLVQQKQGRDAGVEQFVQSSDLTGRLRRSLEARYLKWDRKDQKSVPGASLFSDDRSAQNADVLAQIPPSDVLNLHWVAGFFDYRQFFKRIPTEMRVVWTLHDMNAFTGGCHFDAECGRYIDECGACPQLGSRDENDASRHGWQRKRKAYSYIDSSKFHLVTPSVWLQGEVRKSSLLGHVRCISIPNALDTGVFRPRDAKSSRERFGFPMEGAVILFVADWAKDLRKGFSLLLQALEKFRECKKVYLAALGRELPEAEHGPRFKTIPYIHDDEELSMLYSASDVFALPSLQDNLPNTAIEALSCGVPVVAFDTGGVPEIIDSGENGMLVQVGDVTGFAQAIERLLGDSSMRKNLGEHGRQKALRMYQRETQARRYAQLYRELFAN